MSISCQAMHNAFWLGWCWESGNGLLNRSTLIGMYLISNKLINKQKQYRN